MSTTIPDFPSVFDLGRLVASVDRRMATYGKPDHPKSESDIGSRLCIDLWEHLHGIIAGRRAETLADVAVQLVTAFVVTDWMDAIREFADHEFPPVTMSGEPEPATEPQPERMRW